MKTIGASLQAHLESNALTVALLWKIVRTDATEFHFTSHDRDVVYSGDTYLSATGGMQPSALASRAALNVDNMEVIGLLNSAAIQSDDLLAGVWDYAAVTIYLCNVEDLGAGVVTLKVGTLGEIRHGDGLFTAEIRGIADHFQQSIGERFSPTCRADLGDARCGVNLTSFTFSGTITTINVDKTSFTDSATAQADDYFQFGKLTWTSGNNAGTSVEIRKFESKRFTLSLPMTKAFQVGDGYDAIAGCDKRLSTCLNVFANVDNFRGEPYIPGLDKAWQYGV